MKLPPSERTSVLACTSVASEYLHVYIHAAVVEHDDVVGAQGRPLQQIQLSPDGSCLPAQVAHLPSDVRVLIEKTLQITRDGQGVGNVEICDGRCAEKE